MSTFFNLWATLICDSRAAAGCRLCKRRWILTDEKTDLSLSPFEKFHPIAQADGCGKKSSECGDTIEFFVNLKNDKVTDIRFQIKGCNNTLNAARAAATLVHGKPIKEAMRLSSPKEIDAEANLPKPSKHCANLASEALREALRSAVVGAREPWKKLYRKS
jgi:nitrogen fixation NifU-like protein